MDFHFLYLLFTFGYVFSTGLFNPGGLVILIAFFSFAYIHQPKLDSLTSLKSLLILSLTLTIFFDRMLYPVFPYANHLLKAGFIGAFLLSLSFFFRARLFNQKNIFPLLLFLAFFLRAFIIFASPQPQIDVYYLIKEAPQFLTQLINPYSAIYTKVYPLVVPDYYNYLPLSILFFLPFTLFVLDPRWLYFFVYVVFSIIILKQPNGKEEKLKLYLLLILYQPLSFLVFEQGYLEILLVGFLGSALLFLQNKNWKMASFILGLAIATKQTVFLTLPLFFPYLFKKNRAFSLMLYLFTPLFLTLPPFLVWNIHDFWYDTGYYLLHMDTIRFDKVDFALNTITFFRKILPFDPSTIPLYSFIILLLLYLSMFLLYRIRKKNAAFLSWSLVPFFLGFHLFATQAYINYFFMITNLMVISQIVENSEIKKSTTS